MRMSRTDAIVAKRDCSDGNVGEVRLHDALASCEQNVKPIGVDGQTIGVRAIFGYVAKSLHVWHSARGHIVLL